MNRGTEAPGERLKIEAAWRSRGREKTDVEGVDEKSEAMNEAKGRSRSSCSRPLAECSMTTLDVHERHLARTPALAAAECTCRRTGKSASA